MRTVATVGLVAGPEGAEHVFFFFQLKHRKVVSCCMAEDVYGVGGCV